MLKVFCWSKLSYLVNAGEVLDEKAQKDPGYHSTSHLQHTPQEAVPGGAWSQTHADIRRNKQTVFVARQTWIVSFCMRVTKALARQKHRK